MKRTLVFLVVPAVWVALIVPLALAPVGCSGGSGDSRDSRFGGIRSAEGSGPMAIYTPESEDAINFPFPHDAFTRDDPSTRTGKRVQLPETGETALEVEIRQSLNSFDGFGTFAPIQVSFDAPIDLATIRASADADPANDTLFVLNIDPSSPRFGERVELDLGQGYLPILRIPRSYFPNDSLEGVGQYLFDPSNREVFYEDETNTLLLRPVVPMAASAEHAVVLTKRIRGLEGKPLRSPHAPEVALWSQLDDLDRAIPMLRALGVDPDEVAYAWTFTTMSVTGDLERIREGLADGEGPLGYLRDMFPGRIDHLLPFSNVEGDDYLDLGGNDYLLDPKVVDLIARVAIPLFGGGSELADDVIDQMVDMSSIRSFVQGIYRTPYFLANPQCAFDADIVEGRKVLDPGAYDNVPFFLMIPKPTARNGFAQPPYPVVLFQHPNSTSRLITLGVASIYADYGLAVFGIDAALNGPLLPYMNDQLLAYILGGDLDSNPLLKLLEPLIDQLASRLAAVPIIDLFAGTGRTPKEDVNGDGQIQSGEKTYTADILTDRDVFRQTVVDLVQARRVIQGLGRDVNRNGKLDLEEGDFDQDGVLDVGGAANPLYAAAESLGTFIVGPYLAVDPVPVAAAMNVPGGGIADFVGRIQFGTVDGLFVQAFGPGVVGRPSQAGRGIDVTLVNGVADADRGERIGPFDLPAGTWVRLENLTSEWIPDRREPTNSDGTFLVTIGANAGDSLRLTFEDPWGNPLGLPPVIRQVVRQGFGIERNTPEFRNFVAIAQFGFDPGDIVNYAPHWLDAPLTGVSKKRVLIQSDPDDFIVPTSTAITLGRSGGLISAPRMHQLIDMGVVLGSIRQLGIHSALPSFEYDPPSDDVGLDYDLARTFPFENDHPGSGFVLHLADNHEYLFAPSIDESGTVGPYLTIAAQAQMAIFLSRGEVVVPFKDLLDDLRRHGRTIKPVPGVD